MSRLLVTLLFGAMTALTAVQAAGAVADAVDTGARADAAAALYAVLRLGVVLAFTLFVAVRPSPLRPAREPLAFASCAAAIAAIVLLRRPDESAGTSLVLAGDAVALVFEAWLLASVLTLGRCFGILPEARGLVTHGPYRLVRHPVYLGELGAVGGLLIAAPTWWNAALALLFFLAQLVRMRLEERELTAQFPAYEAYARRTPGLVPRLRRDGGLAPAPVPVPVSSIHPRR
jgi:protein-S-isoprenylcysteine O-methyltransferase Ste14